MQTTKIACWKFGVKYVLKKRLINGIIYKEYTNGEGLMMKKLTKRTMLIILAALITVSSFVSCSDNTVEDKKTESVENKVADAEEIVESEVESEEAASEDTLDVPFTNYEGDTFTALTGDNVTYNWRELTVEEITGEAINDAFYNRNLWVEDALNITISSVVNASVGNATAFKNSVNSGDGAYDVAFMTFYDSSNTATGGYCLDINTMPYVDLDKPWWNQDSIDQLKILGTNYLVASDITIGDKDVMWVLYFDKQYFDDLGLDNPYELVDEGKWTFDVFYDMLKQGLLDLDGNGTYNENDRYGLITHSENYAGLWMSAGESVIKLDSEYNPQISWGSEKFNSVWEKITQIMSDPAVYGSSIDFISSGLKEGKALFATEVVAFIRAYRENDREFGILPMPKYDEAQDRYYTYVAENSDLMVVSKGLEDVARTGEILEVLAAKGREMILPEYYDVSLKSKGARDEESAASLDIIFTNRMYDLGVVFGWGGVVSALKSTDVNLASLYKRYENITNKAMNKAISDMLGD